MSNNWTKGKWEVKEYECGIAIETEGQQICGIRPGVSASRMLPHQEHLANARRICQCINTHDDLLAACRIGLAYIKAVSTGVPRPVQDLDYDKKEVEKAITKAKGTNNDQMPQ